MRKLLSALLGTVLFVAPVAAAFGAGPPSIPMSYLGASNGVPQLGGNGFLRRGVMPPALFSQLIGTRSGVNAVNVTARGITRWNQRTEHWFPYGATSIQIVLPGFSQIAGPTNYRGELTVTPSVYYLKGIKAITTGGANYSVGDYIVMPTWGNGLTPAIVLVDAVNSGAVTAAHVVRGGAYTAPLVDNAAPMAVWQKGFGYGAYTEIPGYSGSNLAANYNTGMNSGGFNYVAANAFDSIAPGPGCTGGNLALTIDPVTGAVTGTLPSGTWTCTNTTGGNAIVAISSGASLGVLGSGFTATMDWGTAAYMARISVDPTYSVETCTNQITGACAHRTVTASSGHPANVSQDLFGIPGDIYVPSGDSVVTDPIPVNIPAGGSAGIRMMLYGNFPTGRYFQLPGEAGAASATVYDLTQAGQYGAGFVNQSLQQPVLQPLAIIGKPQVNGVSVLVVGDSRAQGIDSIPNASTLDTYDLTSGSVGWLERAVGTTMPITNFSRTGDSAYGWMRNRVMRYKAFRTIAATGKFPELCYENMSANDFNQGFSYASVLAAETELVSDLRGFGCKFVFTDTDDPWTTDAGTSYNLIWGDIVAGGTGYAPSSTFPVTISGGTFTQQAVVNVSTDANGVVRSVSSVATRGVYSVKPSGTVATTGGTGTGLTFTPYLSNFVDTSGQVQNPTYTAQAALRNAQLRTSGFGDYANVFDAVIDEAGITETVAGSGLWVPDCTYDGVHAAPACIVAKTTHAAPIIAGYAAQAAAR